MTMTAAALMALTAESMLMLVTMTTTANRAESRGETFFL